MDNLYCSLLESGDVHVPMDEDIQRHVAALRLRDGEHVRVLNGRGLVATCRAERTPQGIRLAVIESTFSAPARPMITVALGVLDHRERFEMAVEKLTELGVARIIPTLCQRSRHLRTTNDRLTAKAIAAITQSGNPFMPLIDSPTELEQVVTSIVHDLVIVGDAHGQPPVEDARLLAAANQVLVVVGPEGGLSDEELQLLASRDTMRRWRIGHLRLRAETAAIALAAVVRSMNG
jgi:16S rRNA (uracil1498-N3)-methyltransferase